VFVWPEELLFYTSLSSPFCVVVTSLITVDTSAHRSQKNKKEIKRDRSLSLARSRSALFQEKRFLKRRFFSLKNVEQLSKKKSGKKIQNLRAGAFTNARAGREREKEERPIFERIELFSPSRCVLCLFFAFAEKERKKRARERERATVRLSYFTHSVTRQREREIKKVTTKFRSSVRAQKRDRATKPKKERTRT